jgi:hypothetical protein
VRLTSAFSASSAPAEGKEAAEKKATDALGVSGAASVFGAAKNCRLTGGGAAAPLP